MTQLNPKQEQFLLNPLRRINLLTGSIRSGKTWVANLLWAMWVRQRPKNELFMMVGKTREALEFNCLGLLDELTGGNFIHSPKSNVGWLYGHEVRLLGANDEKSTAKIKGSTLAGAYIDELTEIPESFYKMTLGRLSVEGAILLATTNPDSPSSYVYTDIVCNDDLDSCVTTFLLEDNLTLPRSYIENIKKEYTGVFYDRYIKGKWAIAEGLVYPHYDNTVPTEPRQYSRYCVSMDYGTMNPTAMILWGKKGLTWYAVNEYYYSGRETNNPLTDEQYYDALLQLCADLPQLKQPRSAMIEKPTLIIDPSAASFIAVVNKHKQFKVRKADNEVIDGIRRTASALKNRRILFNDCCVNTISEFGEYAWDDRATEDTVIKEHDHAMDAVRYFVMTERIYNDKER